MVDFIRAIAISLAALAVLFLCLLVLAVRRVTAFRARARRAEAKVIGFRTEHDGEGSPLYFPIFCFRDELGQEHKIFSTTGTSPPEFEEGSSAIVLFDPQEPRHARLATFAQQWFIPTVFAGCSVVCGFIAAAFFLLGWLGVR
jgi:hypothetical protein